MMCEHKWEIMKPERFTFCKDCGKTIVEIELEQKLAAANARVAELEQRKPCYKAEFDCVYEKLKAEEQLSAHYKQRAEQAEAKLAEHLTDSIYSALLKENRRMREALERLVDESERYLWQEREEGRDLVHLARAVDLAKAAIKPEPTNRTKPESGAPFDEDCPNPDKERSHEQRD